MDPGGAVPVGPRTPVLVVGAGPVGCVLALELARQGVPTQVVDRTSGPPVFPKMDFLNGRSMELLRRLGLSGRVRRVGVDTDHASDFVWTHGPAQPPLSTWHHPSPARLADEAREVDDGSAPLEVYQRVQGSRLEALLREQIREHPLVEVREGWSFTGGTEDDAGVTARVRNTATGDELDLRTEFLVGCDGANSTVRRSTGTALETTGQPTTRCSVYFRSRDPRLRSHGRAFVTLTSRGTTLVSRDERDLWTASFPEEPSSATEPVAALRAGLGLDVAVDEVISVGRWQGTLAVAADYRRGRTFLAGDAAHQFYPFGGHGVNTGIGDAVDLGWKLAACLAGWGGPALLDSYTAERRPVALFNREMSAALLEVARRFLLMAREELPAEQIAGYLDRQAHQVHNTGVHFGSRYAGSPVVWHEAGPAPAWHWGRITPTTWPGARPPSLRLTGGTALFDLFGTGFTLVDLSGAGRGRPLVDAAVARGIPMVHLPVDDPAARTAWERDLVLVRPDQHVAWRGDDAPGNWAAVLDRVRGTGSH